MARLKKSSRLGRKLNPGKRSLTPVAGPASHAGRDAHTIAVTISAKFAGFHINDVPIKIPLVLGFLGHMALTLLASVG
jgi:hypothetical protein